MPHRKTEHQPTMGSSHSFHFGSRAASIMTDGLVYHHFSTQLSSIPSVLHSGCEHTVLGLSRSTRSNVMGIEVEVLSQFFACELCRFECLLQFFILLESSLDHSRDFRPPV